MLQAEAQTNTQTTKPGAEQKPDPKQQQNKESVPKVDPEATKQAAEGSLPAVTTPEVEKFDMGFDKMGRHYNSKSALWDSHFKKPARTAEQTAKLLEAMRDNKLPNSRNSYLDVFPGPIGSGGSFSVAEKATVAKTLTAMKKAVDGGLVNDADGQIKFKVGKAIEAFEKRNGAISDAVKAAANKPGAPEKPQVKPDQSDKESVDK